MGRYYKLSKPVSEEEAAQIMSEICELENVMKAELNEDRTGITVFTKDGEYTDVMNRAVNIFSREGNKTALSFERFVPEE